MPGEEQMKRRLSPEETGPKRAMMTAPAAGARARAEAVARADMRLAGPASEIKTWDAGTTDYCLDRIVTTNDGGVATLDSKP
eukprot:COSAG02_NODE_39191_length_420_cov_0.635514_1_plen_81_part_01